MAVTSVNGNFGLGILPPAHAVDTETSFLVCLYILAISMSNSRSRSLSQCHGHMLENANGTTRKSI